MAETVDASRVMEIHDSAEDLEEKIDQLAELVRKSRYTVLFTGAGVSTAAGIADYRGPSGCWTIRRIQELEANCHNASATEQAELQQLRAEQEREVAKCDPAAKKVPKEFVEPGFTHMAIATMVNRGLAHYVVTTNLDGLFRKAGLAPHQELCCLHGDVFVERCTNCKAEFERNYRVRRPQSHAHDHRATGSGECARCGSVTPAEWTGMPKGASASTRLVTMKSRPREENVTVARVTANARQKYPGASLLSVNGICVKDADDTALRSVVSKVSLPLQIELCVPGSRGGAETGGGATFTDNHLVGSCGTNIGTKDTHINFGEGLDDIDWNEAGEHCNRADLCIVLGTSMSLGHVVHFPFMAKKTIIVNLQKTPYDHRCFRGLRIWATCDEVMQRLLPRVGIEHVLEPPPWRPKDAVPLKDLEQTGLSSRQLDLVRHIEETARRRERAMQAMTAAPPAASQEVSDDDSSVP